MRAHRFVLVDLITAGGHQDHQTNPYEDPGNEVHRGTFGWFARPVPFTIVQCADGLKLEDVHFCAHVFVTVAVSKCVCLCVCKRVTVICACRHIYTGDICCLERCDHIYQGHYGKVFGVGFFVP